MNRGDAGAGLTYSHSNTYYLTGVVSVKDPNTDNQIALFTEIKYHIPWIRELYYKYVLKLAWFIFYDNFCFKTKILRKNIHF